jgi:N-dimethylarginine dimethylaminohydrolase
MALEKMTQSAEDFLDGKNEEGSIRFVMCPPKFLSTDIPNNVFMKKGHKVDVPRALAQYGRIKNVIEAFGVEVLEIPPVKGCQDQTFVANIGIALNPYIVLANYKADGRDCEVAPAKKFFEGMGYQTIQPPTYFEGEADLKRLKQDVYIGGYGQFSDEKTFDWIEKKCGVKIIRVKETNPKTYHLDCCILVINDETLLIAEGGLDKSGIKELEKHAELIMTPDKLLTTGCTNAVLLREKEICLSGAFNPEDANYRKAMDWLNETFDKFGFTCVFLDVDEFDASGADLSCMVMHLDFMP